MLLNLHYQADDLVGIGGVGGHDCMQRVGVQCNQRDAEDIVNTNTVNEEWKAHLTVNSSKQNNALMKGIERGPKAFRPMSE